MTADFEPISIDLAREPDFSLGRMRVRPSLRQIESGGAAKTIEPRVMQVLVALFQRRGEVVGRDELVQRCWDGRIVGDDAISRVIGRVRKLGEAEGSFALETIPRVGYRLVANAVVEPAQAGSPQAGASQAEPSRAEPSRAGPSQAGAAAAARLNRRGMLIAAATGLAVLVAGVGAWAFLGRTGRPALEPSIAVLPFANLTGDSEKDYFARGVAVEIIEQLSRLDGLKVIARNSSFTFASDADPRKVGENLHVAHVLSGTVSEEGGRIHVSADLADARTGEAIWARPFESELAPQDPYAVQRGIAERVAGAMSIAFDVGARAHLAGSGTRSLEAYDYYLRGLDQWWYRGNRQLSAELFGQAVELDPDYADAWAGRAIAAASMWSQLAPAEARVQQDAAYVMVQRAVKLDPDLGFAQAVLGAISSTQLKWSDAETATLRALEISRTDMALNNREMLLLRTGRLSDAYAVMQELQSADPLRGPDDLGVSNLLAAMGRHAELRKIMADQGWSGTQDLRRLDFLLIAQVNAGGQPAAVRQSLEAISQRTERGPADLARAVLAVFDKPEKARAVLRSAYEDESFRNAAKWDLIPALAALYGDTNLVMRVWKDEFPTHISRMAYMWGPAFAKARAQPEFKDLMRETGLVDFWRGYGWPDKCRPLGDADFECS